MADFIDRAKLEDAADQWLIEDENWGDRHHESFMAGVDAVLSSLALEPEAREEPKHGLIEDYTAVQAPDWTKVSGKLGTRDVTDAEVEAAAKAIVLDTLRATRSAATFDEVAVEQMPGALREARAALEAAREVSRG